MFSIYDKGRIKLTCKRRHIHKKMWVDQNWIHQRGISWVKWSNHFCCTEDHRDGTKKHPTSTSKLRQPVNINHAKASFFTTFLSKSCLVWNAWAWYAKGGNSQKMWFSPNHRANHALWFWFPCITDLKLWNHLIHIHTYVHRHTCMRTQLSWYRFWIQIQNPAHAVSHCRPHVPNISTVMNFTAEITAQCSLRSISCGDRHNFVLINWAAGWRTRQQHHSSRHGIRTQPGEGTHPNALDATWGEVLIPSILQHRESRNYGVCRHGKQMRREPSGVNTCSSHSLVSKAVMKFY